MNTISRSIYLALLLVSFFKNIESVSVPSAFVDIDLLDRIVVAKSSFNGTDFDFAVLRYLNSGILDVTFGGINNFGNLYPGMVTTDIEGGDDVIYSMFIDDETDKINVAGSSQIDVDQIFNVSSIPVIEGILSTTSFGNVIESLLTSTQKDGIVETILSVTSVSRFALARYNTNGTLDTTFNPQGLFSPTRPGIVITPIGLIAEAKALIQTFDKKLLAGGFSVDVPTSDIGVITAVSDLTLAKYNINGSLDKTFNATGPTPGIVTTSLGGDGIIYGLTEDSFNNVVACGSLDFSNFLVARYLPNGTLDPTFNPLGETPGVVITTFTDFFEIAIAFSVIIDDDDNILVAGVRQTDQTAALTLARYDLFGNLDITFGDGGLVNIPIPFANIIVDALTIDADNKIIVSAFTRNTNITTRQAVNFFQPFILLKLNEDGSFVKGFNQIGLTPIIPVSPTEEQFDTIIEDELFNIFSDVSNSVIIDNNGKILVAGYVNYAVIRNLVVLARYFSNGVLDTSFNPRGATGIIDNPNVENPDDDNLFPGNEIINSLFNTPYFLFPPGIVVTNTFYDTLSLRLVIGGGSSSGFMAIKKLIEAGGSTLIGAEPEENISKVIFAPRINYPTNDLVVSEKSITIRGISDPYSFINIDLNNTRIKDIYVSGDGSWQYKTPDLVDGEHLVRITALDNTGASRANSNVIKFIVSSIVLTPPIITSPRSAAINNNSVNVSGYSQPGFTVVIFLNNQIIGTTNSNAMGNWSFNLGNLNPGSYKIHAIITDGINRISSSSNTVNVNQGVSSSQETSKKANTNLDVSKKETMVHIGDRNITADTVISGKATPNSIVRVFVDNIKQKSIKTNKDGNWAYNIIKNNFNKGFHTIKFITSDKSKQSVTSSINISI